MIAPSVYAITAILAALPLLLLLIRIIVRLNVGPCTCPDSMKGKVVVVTGASRGIGYETARELARRGARVVLVCRSDARAAAARRLILRDHPACELQCRPLDLASLASVRQFAARLLREERRLDVLVNNAAAIALGNRRTRDGILEEMQVNHFGPFLLTLLLLPLLKRTAGSRIVNVSSIAHHLGVIDTRHMNVEGYYGDGRTYANSKLCNVAFTWELARRLRGSTVSAHCLHPGISYTGVMATSGVLMSVLFRVLCAVCGRSAREAAQCGVHVAVNARASSAGPHYHVERRARNWAVAARATDPTVGARLWKYSETLVRHKYEDDSSI